MIRMRLSTKVSAEATTASTSTSLQHLSVVLQSILPCAVQAIKTLEKKGLQAMAKDIGLNLYKLPYEDVSPGRLEWLAKNGKGYPPQPSKIGKSRRMKNSEKLAASQKRPLQARYLTGSRVILTRDPKYVEEYRN